MSRCSLRGLLLVLALGGAGPSCTRTQHVSARDAEARAAAPLLPPSRIPYDFMWRQRVTAEWPTGKQSFEAVLQKRDGTLVMLGLSPMGLPGFTLTLGEDTALHVQNRMGRELPFEPVYVIADVERVFFPWFQEPPTGPERTADIGGFHVHERFEGGVLRERSFARPGAEGSVRITYDGHAAGLDAPTRVRLVNPWYRYALEIETFEQTRL